MNIATAADDVEASEVGAELATVPTERLEADLLSWAADIAAAEARWLVWLAEYDRRKGWSHWGVRSAAHWLNWKCGISLHAAQEKVRTARALVDLSQVRSVFEAGMVSYSKVRAVTRAATPADESYWVSLALSSTASQLERIVAGQRSVDTDDPGESHAARSVTRRELSGGLRRIVVDLPADLEEVVWSALERGVEAIIADAIGDGRTKVTEVVQERGGRAALRADALVDIAESAVSVEDDDSVDRDRRLGHLHLVAQLGETAAELDDEPVDVAVLLNDRLVAGPVGHRWCCDIDTSAIVETADGIPVGETDKRRTPNRAMR